MNCSKVEEMVKRFFEATTKFEVECYGEGLSPEQMVAIKLLDIKSTLEAYKDTAEADKGKGERLAHFNRVFKPILDAINL